MVNTEYAIAYKEIYEILKYVPIEDYNKIPKEKIELYETMQDKDYNFTFDPTKTLEEQNVSKRAKVIIGLLFRDYWATDEQRKKIIAKQRYERQKIEAEKALKYDSNNIFKNNEQYNSTENNATEEVSAETQLVKYKESIFKNIINKILKLLHIK